MSTSILRKLVCLIQVFVFTFTSLVLPSNLYAQSIVSPALTLPAVGEMVNVSKAFTPVLIKGLTMDQSDPLKFEFLMDQGDSDLQGEALKAESYKLIKYFMASMTTPEEDLWVNLSPYEKDRIIPESLGKTEMGRDLLSQDYILKQLTATLMSPEGETGKRFWERVYERLYDSVGNGLKPFPTKDNGDVLQDAINSFNKIWIVPQTGYFYEHNNSVLITDAKLKVMLEEDYVAAQKAMGVENYGLDSRDVSLNQLSSPNATQLSSPNVSVGDPSLKQNRFPTKAFGNDMGVNNDVKQIIREVIIPVIEQEVNEGEHFAPLRQVYNAMLLAVWFKKRIKHHILSDVYVDQRKVKGIDFNDLNANEAIWKQYVETFKSGVADTIQDEYDPATQSVIPKKYFVGGTTPLRLDNAQMTKQRPNAKDSFRRPYTAPLVFNPETGNSVMLDTVTLRNGSKESYALILTITVSLELLLTELPGILAVYDLREILRNPQYQMLDNSRKILQSRGLINAQGPVHDSIRNIVLSAVIGEGLNIHLESPIAANPAMMVGNPQDWIKKHMSSYDVISQQRRGYVDGEKEGREGWGWTHFVVFEKDKEIYTQLLGVHHSGWGVMTTNDQGVYEGDLNQAFNAYMKNYEPKSEWWRIGSFLESQTKANLAMLDGNMVTLRNDSEMMNKAEPQVAGQPANTGGVNLRSDQADIQIQEDENGFKFPKFDPAMRMMPLERLTPVILDLKFITIADAAMKLGLAVPAEDSSDNVYSPDKAREQELLTAL